jgi:hypothetical protein
LEAVKARKETHVSEDFENVKPEGEISQSEDEDVEAHGLHPAAAAAEAAATEEGPDVEAHNVKPNVKP